MKGSLLLRGLEHIITHDFFDLFEGDIVNVEFSQYLSSTFLVAKGLFEDVLDVGTELSFEF